MTFDDLAQRTAGWLAGGGSGRATVLSSRVRLARNLTDLPFTHRATDAQKQRVIDDVAGACRKRSAISGLTYFDTSGLSKLQRQFLVERHLISPALANGKGPRGVLVDGEEVLSVMVNEEDHLRIQVILAGYQARQAWLACNRLSDELGDAVGFATSPRWGYLTACATNTGTGLRASTLIHLPGLVLTKEMDGVVRGVAQMGFTVRGLYGEGTESAGNLYQISNQVTMGRSEEALVDSLDRVVAQVVACEDNARDTVMNRARRQIEDKVWRAYGILRNARMLTSQELMNFSSALRLGVDLGILEDVDARVLNRVMVESKPSHLQIRAGRTLEPEERDALRARIVRERITG